MAKRMDAKVWRRPCGVSVCGISSCPSSSSLMFASSRALARTRRRTLLAPSFALRQAERAERAEQGERPHRGEVWGRCSSPPRCARVRATRSRRRSFTRPAMGRWRRFSWAVARPGARAACPTTTTRTVPSCPRAEHHPARRRHAQAADATPAPSSGAHQERDVGLVLLGEVLGLGPACRRPKADERGVSRDPLRPRLSEGRGIVRSCGGVRSSAPRWSSSVLSVELSRQSCRQSRRND
jgi:hypothetical protein